MKGLTPEESTVDSVGEIIKTVEIFTCERCGYKYQKQFDHPPLLCHRCLRFLGKGIYKLYNQMQPSTSAPPIPTGD